MKPAIINMTIIKYAGSSINSVYFAFKIKPVINGIKIISNTVRSPRNIITAIVIKAIMTSAIIKPLPKIL